MKRISVFCCILVLVAGCAGVKSSYPNKPTPEAQNTFNTAEAEYRNKQFSSADTKFADFIQNYPYTELTDEARFLRGEIAFAKKKYENAIVFYRESFSKISSPSIAPKAHFKTALSLYNLNRNQEALDELNKIDRKSASAILKIRADSLAIKILKTANAPQNSIITWNLFLLDDYSESRDISASGIPRNEIISNDIALKEVRRFVEDKNVTIEDIELIPLKAIKGKRSGGYAYYKLALVYHTTGDTKAAKRELKNYLTTYPKHEYYSKARELMTELGGEVGNASGVSVGVVLPLSGKFAVYGESALHGIECAAGVYMPCQGPAGIKIIVKDSNLIGSAKAIEELAAEKDVIAIIGPLTSGDALDTAKKAQELAIPLMSVSQREDITQSGDFIFRNSVSDSSEMSTLAEYVTKKIQMKKFLAFYPKNKKGAEYFRLFNEEIKSRGGKIVSSREYSPNEVGVGSDLRNRGDGSEEEDSGLNITNNASSFDAVFIPDSLPVAAYIAQKHDLNTSEKLKLLGVSRWDDQKLIDRAQGYANGAIFVDSFYKGADSPDVSSFVTNFKSAYNVDPTLLEALGFDSMRLIISAVIDRGASHRDSVRDALAQISDFSGVTGKITFNKNREAERELWVLMVKDGVIKPAE